MKKNILVRRTVSIFICCIFIAGTMAGGQTLEAETPNKSKQVKDQPIESNVIQAKKSVGLNDTKVDSALEETPTRQTLSTQVVGLKTDLDLNSKNNFTRLTYARKLFQLGNFAESKNIAASLLKEEKPTDEAIYLSAQIEYVMGNYKESENLFNKLNKGNSMEYQTKAQTGLLYTYYQTNQFHKAKNLTADLEKDLDEPLREMMKDFGKIRPYEIEWNGNSKVVVPFIANELLPAVSIMVNGKQINAIIDTGGDTFILDETMAASLGIKNISSIKGTYAGGIVVETGYGRLDSLSLNGVTLKSVPVMIAPIKQFSVVYNDEIEVNGIITTGVLKQFLATMDYPCSQLILRPRNKQGKTILKQYLAKHNTIDEIPFTLATSHFMMAKGSINGKDSLNFFMDSGLATEKTSMILLEQTMVFAGIPIPKAEKRPGDIGGLGGNDFEVGEFTVDVFKLGKLPSEKDIWAEYATLEASFNYDESMGFLVDGLISHNFLKKYSWTIDFDSMKMIFSD